MKVKMLKTNTGHACTSMELSVEELGNTDRWDVPVSKDTELLLAIPSLMKRAALAQKRGEVVSIEIHYSASQSHRLDVAPRAYTCRRCEKFFSLDEMVNHVCGECQNIEAQDELDEGFNNATI